VYDALLVVYDASFVLIIMNLLHTLARWQSMPTNEFKQWRLGMVIETG
jgi:hypothetical protein